MQILTRCYTKITKNLYAALDEDLLDEINERNIDIKGLIIVLTDLFRKLMPDTTQKDLGVILNMLKEKFLKDHEFNTDYK